MSLPLNGLLQKHFFAPFPRCYRFLQCYIGPRKNLSLAVHKKLCYRRRTARRAMSVKILSTVEKSCTTNPQQIKAMELESYSWGTCSKQPQLVDCHIDVVNKLDRRQRP